MYVLDSPLSRGPRTGPATATAWQQSPVLAAMLLFNLPIFVALGACSGARLYTTSTRCRVSHWAKNEEVTQPWAPFDYR